MAVRRHQSWALFSWCLWIRIPCVLLLLSYSFLFVLLIFHSKGHPKALLWCCCKVICTLLHQRGRHDRAKEYSSKIANHWDWVDVFGYIDLHLRYCATLCGSLVFFVSISKYDQPAASLEHITGAKHTHHFYDVPVPQSCLTDSDHSDALFNMCWSNRGCFFSRDFNQLNGRSVAGFLDFNQMSWSWSFLLALWWSWYVFVSRVAGWKNGPSWNFMNI